MKTFRLFFSGFLLVFSFVVSFLSGLIVYQSCREQLWGHAAFAMFFVIFSAHFGINRVMNAKEWIRRADQ